MRYYTVTVASKITKHVIYKDNRWVVKSQGLAKANSAETYDTQQEAVQAARSLAKKSGSALVIHGRDGRIRDVDSYDSKATVEKLIPPQ